MKWILIGLALIWVVGSGFGQEMKMIQVEELVWTDHPVFKEAKTVILVGLMRFCLWQPNQAVQRTAGRLENYKDEIRK